jgi:hypothetical protein
VSDYKAIGYTDWEWIVARAGELYDRQRKSKRGISGQGIFREDGHEYWYAVAAQERIAAALNAQAGVVDDEATVERLAAHLYRRIHGNFAFANASARKKSEMRDEARAALAAVKEVKP